MQISFNFFAQKKFPWKIPKNFFASEILNFEQGQKNETGCKVRDHISPKKVPGEELSRRNSSRKKVRRVFFSRQLMEMLKQFLLLTFVGGMTSQNLFRKPVLLLFGPIAIL